MYLLDYKYHIHNIEIGAIYQVADYSNWPTDSSQIGHGDGRWCRNSQWQTDSYTENKRGDGAKHKDSKHTRNSASYMLVGAPEYRLVLLSF